MSVTIVKDCPNIKEVCDWISVDLVYRPTGNQSAYYFYKFEPLKEKLELLKIKFGK